MKEPINMGTLDPQQRLDVARGQPAPSGAVPDGCRLVPTLLTDDMAEAADEEGTPTLTRYEQAQRRWDAVLAAAPQPAARQEQGDEVRRLREAVKVLIQHLLLLDQSKLTLELVDAVKGSAALSAQQVTRDEE